jgi:hypothetical protein
MDSVGGILKALVVPEENPVVWVFRRYTALLDQPMRDDTFGPVFHQFGAGSIHGIHIAIRATCFSILAMLWINLRLYLDDFPYKLVGLCAGVVAALALAAELLGTPDCCLDVDFGLKVKRMAGSPQELLDITSLMNALRSWSHNGTLSNMHLERLLAAIRHAVGRAKAPHAQRYQAAGLLTQLLTVHTKAGGKDPRRTTRSSAIDIGAPLAVTKVRNKLLKPQMRRGVLMYYNSIKTQRHVCETATTASLYVCEAVP